MEEECSPSETCVTVTERIRSWLSNSSRCEKVPHELKLSIHDKIDSFKEKGSTIPFKFLKVVYSLYTQEESGLYIHEVLDGARIILPQPPERERNPELQARIEKLKEEQREREYKEMIKNVTNKPSINEESIGKQYKQLNRQLITVFNFLLTCICMFAFAYKATEYAIGPNIAMQLMAGLISGTIVFVADLYFIIKNDL